LRDAKFRNVSSVFLNPQVENCPMNRSQLKIQQKIKTYLDNRVIKIFQKLKIFYEIIYIHILVHIYVSYAMLNNIFLHLGRISRNTVQDYQIIIIIIRHNLGWSPLVSTHSVGCDVIDWCFSQKYYNFNIPKDFSNM
jgi:hypothetical protein